MQPVISEMSEPTKDGQMVSDSPKNSNTLALPLRDEIQATKEVPLISDDQALRAAELCKHLFTGPLGGNASAVFYDRKSLQIIGAHIAQNHPHLAILGQTEVELKRYERIVALCEEMVADKDRVASCPEDTLEQKNALLRTLAIHQGTIVKLLKLKSDLCGGIGDAAPVKAPKNKPPVVAVQVNPTTVHHHHHSDAKKAKEPLES